MVVKALRRGLNSDMGARGDDYHVLYLVAHRAVSRKHISARIRRATRRVQLGAIRRQRHIFQVYNYPEGKICEA